MTAGKHQTQAALMLDHLIMFNEVLLRRTLNLNFEYYHKSRTYLSLAKDSPEPRLIKPVERGESWRYHWSVVFTTATNDEPLEQTFSFVLLIVPMEHPSRSALRPYAAHYLWPL